MEKCEPHHIKRCFMPSCTNTNVSTPEKVFVTVPKDDSRRKKWFTAAGQHMPPTSTVFHCCEDHFNLEEDMENYIRFKLMGGKVFLKKEVVPRVFKCQSDKKRAISGHERLLPAILKRRRLSDEVIRENYKNQQNVPSTNVDAIYTSNEPCISTIFRSNILKRITTAIRVVSDRTTWSSAPVQDIQNGLLDIGDIKKELESSNWPNDNQAVSDSYYQIGTEYAEIKLEDLHHAIDIKDEVDLVAESELDIGEVSIVSFTEIILQNHHLPVIFVDTQNVNKNINH